MFGKMKIYTVHIKPGVPNAAEKPIFIREGFNFWAFFFTIFWTLYYRLWLHTALIIAVNVVIVVLGNNYILGSESIGLIQFTIQLLVGFHANDWYRAALSKRGYIMTDITTGDNLLRAEQRYFERYLANAA